MSEKNKKSSWKNDLPASLVVYLVALPLCLGIAFASTDVQGVDGLPNIFSGIIAGVVGGIIVGALSGSRLGVSGPAAGLITIVAGAIATLGSFEGLLLAVFLSGIIQLIAGFLKAGVIGNYFPSAVIKGMLAAIGLTLILKEIPHLLGYDKEPFGELAFNQHDGQNTFTEILYAYEHFNIGAIIIGIVSIAILILFERPFLKKIALFKFLPGALFVVVTGILLNLGFQTIAPELNLTGDHLVILPVASSFGDFLGFFRAPDFSLLSNPNVYVIAFTLAIVGSLETLLSVEATDKLDPLRHSTPTNRELKAQGVGNIVSGLIGGLPITQVIVRSSANINAGGTSKISAIAHGFILIGTVVIIPELLNMIPLTSLAAILLLVGYKLSKIGLYKSMYKLGWEQFVPFIATIVMVLLTDLLKGIAFGMALAIFFILRSNYRNNYSKNISKKNGKPFYNIVLSEEVTFLNKGSIRQTLNELPEDSIVVIDGKKCGRINYDVLEVIQEFEKFGAKEKNIDFSTINIEHG
jgi:carbonic anhydrase